MKDKPEILILLTPGFPADRRDSTCLTSQQQLVLALNRICPQVRIIILTLEYPFRRKAYRWNGNLVVPFDSWEKGVWYKLQSWVRLWGIVRRLKRSGRVSGIFSCWCREAALLGKWVGKWEGIPHYCWVLGQDAKKENRWVRWIRPSGGELVAMSEFLAEEFYRQHGIRPERIIHNALDPGMFGNDAVARDIDLLGVGSLIPLKRYDWFIDVVGALVPRMPKLRAVICGKGPERDMLEAMIHARGLAGHIVLAGELPHGEVLALMRRSRLLLHPSSYEGYSTVCLEALYAGAHVCSLWKPGPGWIRHWHVVQDKEELMEQVGELLADPALDHERVLLYSMDECAGKVMGLFKPGEGNIAYYDAIAKEYDHLMDQSPENALVRAAVADRFTRVVPPGLVLDFGGGTGMDMAWLVGNRYRVIFCEPSAGMRERAGKLRERLLGKELGKEPGEEESRREESGGGDSGRGESGRVELGRVQELVRFVPEGDTDFTEWGRRLPWGERVDAILSNFAVLNSIADIALLFRNLALVIRPQGHFFAMVLRHSPGLIRKGGRMEVRHGECRQAVYLYSAGRIREAAAPWFQVRGIEPLEDGKFALVHLVRND